MAKSERDGTAQNALISLGPWTAWTVLGAIDLALRHPHVPVVIKEQLGEIREQLSVLFDGTPGEEALRQGADPANDR